jgi:cytochrome c-type biogenesis protein CcmH/NrfF
MTNDIETLALCLAPFVTLLLVAVLIDYIVRRAKQRWNK